MQHKADQALLADGWSQASIDETGPKVRRVAADFLVTGDPNNRARSGAIKDAVAGEESVGDALRRLEEKHGKVRSVSDPSLQGLMSQLEASKGIAKPRKKK